MPAGKLYLIEQCKGYFIFYNVYFKLYLKLVPAIFYQICIFSSNHSSLKTIKNVFLFHLKSSLRFGDFQFFIIFSLPFHTFQIQKDKWKWNNL